MKQRLTAWFAILLTCGLWGCSDDEKAPARASILDQTVARIAADALSAMPSADFVAARARVNGRLDDALRDRARNVVLAPGSGGAVVLDADVTRARRAAALGLGATLDPAREADVAGTETALAALLAEVKRLNAAATTCAALPAPKSDDCAVAFVIIEVRRSEVPRALTDAGTSDAGADAGDAGPAVPFAWIDCGARDATGLTPQPTILMGDVSWSGTVLLRGDVYFYNGKLTIAPGTRVLLDADSNLYLGWNSGAMTVIADATPTAPITFCGTRGDRGFWESVRLGREVTSDSVLRNVLFADGGGDEVALVLDADVLVDNVQVRNVEQEGVHARDFAPSSRALSVQGAGEAPVVLLDVGAATRFPLGGAFADNTEAVVRVRFTSIEGDQTLHAIGLPYRQEQDVYHYNGKLTLAPGVEYRVQPDGTLHVGWNGGVGELHANGTIAAPVRLRGVLEQSGSWKGLTVGTGVASTSNLTYTELSHAGAANQSALDLRATLVVDHLSLSDNAVGAVVNERGFASTSSTLSITRTRGRPLKINPNAVGTIPLGSSFTGNDVDQVEIEADFLEAATTFRKIGVPYFFTATTFYTSGATLTLEPGTSFVMGADAEWRVGWNGASVTLSASGTAAEPIVFRGADPRAGYWRGITVERGVTSSSQLTQLTVEHAGGGGRGALELQVALPVTNSRFNTSAGYGIRRPAGATVDYTTTNTFTAVAILPVADL
ncbi:MAG: hypothetical protein ABW252_15215 [Polyangiales bacterium]